jgi:hypothetical protein
VREVRDMKYNKIIHSCHKMHKKYQLETENEVVISYVSI